MLDNLGRPFFIVDEQTMQDILILFHSFEAEEPLSAMGFFSVQRSTLTAEFGIIVTYIIILYQLPFCTPQ